MSPANTWPPPSLRQREEAPTGGIRIGAGAGTGDWVARAAEADWLWIVTDGPPPLPGEQPNSRSRTATADRRRIKTLLGRRPPGQPREGQSDANRFQASYQVGDLSCASSLVSRRLPGSANAQSASEYLKAALVKTSTQGACVSPQEPVPTTALRGRSAICWLCMICAESCSLTGICARDVVGVERPPVAAICTRGVPNHKSWCSFTMGTIRRHGDVLADVSPRRRRLA
jgi:hypothetical protein